MCCSTTGNRGAVLSSIGNNSTETSKMQHRRILVIKCIEVHKSLKKRSGDAEGLVAPSSGAVPNICASTKDGGCYCDR